MKTRRDRWNFHLFNVAKVDLCFSSIVHQVIPAVDKEIIFFAPFFFNLDGTLRISWITLAFYCEIIGEIFTCLKIIIKTCYEIRKSLKNKAIFVVYKRKCVIQLKNLFWGRCLHFYRLRKRRRFSSRLYISFFSFLFIFYLCMLSDHSATSRPIPIFFFCWMRNSV